MKVPEAIIAKIKARLWEQADRDGWGALNGPQKSAMYEQWSTDKAVGGVLSQYMEKAQVRVYLKDSIMKPYVRQRTSDAAPALKAAGIAENDLAIQNYEKPHGRMLFDKRVVCWGHARDWKTILLAVYERAYREMGKPYSAVLFGGVGKMAQPGERRIVQDLGDRLGIQKIEWPD